MINPNQLRSVIQRTLKKFEELGGATYSEEAVELLMMVAAHESKLGTYLRQIKGPALGPYQHEPETIRDLYRVVISKNQKLDFAVAKFVPSAKSLSTRDYSELVETDLRYATVLARVHFMRFKEPIPKDEPSMAKYAKKYWNTEAGAAKDTDYYTAYWENCR